MPYILGGYVGTGGGGMVVSGSVSSGSITPGSISSGAVGSGNIASGAVQGFFGSTRHIASGTVGVFDLGSGAVVAGSIGSGAVVSGNIASGQIDGMHFASGAIIDAARWLVATTFLTAETISGGRCVGFNQSGALVIAMAAVSGRMPAIGIAADNALSGQSLNVYEQGKLFSTAFNFSGYPNQPVFVGESGFLVVSGAPLNSGNLQQVVGVTIHGSGLFVLVGDTFNSFIAQSGDIGSGAITGGASSGNYCVASGTLNTYDHSSGTCVRAANYVAPLHSGTAWSVITAENISGVRAVALDQSGHLVVAMASVSGRMPAIGIVSDGVLSGIPANVYTQGFIQHTSGLADYSGYLAKRLWVGRSGQITTLSGSWSSGGFASGDLGQPIGTAINSGAVLANVHPVEWSGGPLGVAAGGTF